MAGELSGKIAVITGASEGIGRATALAWARAGADLVVAARSKGRLEELAQEVRSIGRRCVPVSCDVSRESDVARLADETRQFGDAGVLFNCAGFSGYGSVSGIPVEAWDRTIAVNLRGTFLCCRAFLPVMTARRSGAIINVASAERGYPNKSAYNASKVAVVTLTQALAEEVRDFGISVNAVRFGIIVNTRLGQEINPEITDRRTWQRPEDVTGILTLLASQNGTFVTGGYINILEWKRQLGGPLLGATTPPPAT